MMLTPAKRKNCNNCNKLRSTDNRINGMTPEDDDKLLELIAIAERRTVIQAGASLSIEPEECINCGA